MPVAGNTRGDGAQVAASLLTDGYRVRMRVTGDSMTPTLRHGDDVELAPRIGRSLRRGDIVLITTTFGGFALHRVLRAWGKPWQRVQTRGDNQWRLDDAVPIAQVHGVLIGVRRRGGWRRAEGRFKRGFRALGGLAMSGLRYRVKGQADRSLKQRAPVAAEGVTGAPGPARAEH